MKHPLLKLWFNGAMAIISGSLLYHMATESPAFAQATAGQSATTGTTTIETTGQPQRRVSRPRTGGIGGTDVRGGQGRPGSPTTADPVALTAAECRELGGDITISSNASCRYSDGSRGDVCVTRRDELRNGVVVSEVHNACINERR